MLGWAYRGVYESDSELAEGQPLYQLITPGSHPPTCRALRDSSEDILISRVIFCLNQRLFGLPGHLLFGVSDYRVIALALQSAAACRLASGPSSSFPV